MLRKQIVKKEHAHHDLFNLGYHRLRNHYSPKVGFMKNPIGMVLFNGKYHLFYEYNPYEPNQAKAWAHATSDDLVHWDEEEVSLYPTFPYEKDGCLAGSLIVDQNQLILFYTGQSIDFKGQGHLGQCIATSSDGIHFDKSVLNPVLDQSPIGYANEMKHPMVYKRDDQWFMVIGGQSEDQELGKLLLYQSHDLANWDFKGELAGASIDMGHTWEYPNLFQLDEKDVLMFSPHGIRSLGMLYNNLYQSGYVVGTLDCKSGQLKHGKFYELDRGFDFYAPHIMIDEQNRRIMVASMGLSNQEDVTDFEWFHALTLPRELKQNDQHKILQIPIEELKRLRKNEVQYKYVLFENEIQLPDVFGDVFELELEVNVEDLEKFMIVLRASDDYTEKTLLSYMPAKQLVTLDRDYSGKGPGGVRQCILSEKGLTKLRIFSDTSSLEIFINDGEEVFTARIFPHEKSQNISFIAKGGYGKIIKLNIWDIEI